MEPKPRVWPETKVVPVIPLQAPKSGLVGVLQRTGGASQVALVSTCLPGQET